MKTPLLSFATASPKTHQGEDDLAIKKTQQVKDTELINPHRHMPQANANARSGMKEQQLKKINMFSYKAMVTGEMSKANKDVEAPEIADFWKLNPPAEGLRIEERKYEDYDCPEIILSELEEKRIAAPLKKGVIVKMLGRIIGYKALENRLNQLWAKREK